MTEELGDLYSIVVANGIDPARAGYPVHRKPIVILGSRTDQVNVTGLNTTATALFLDGKPVLANFRQLLGLNTDALIPWENMWSLFGADYQRALIVSGCTCTIDPFAMCVVHACKCSKRCKDDPTSTACAWRSLHNGVHHQ